jgi:CubicO group peptidase (beta-lactamase class C family)
LASPVSGSCDARFARVREEFERNFSERGEIGAAVCVYHRGLAVVDLWGGFRNAAKTEPWVRDTLVCMMSIGKSMAALCTLMLVDRGRLNLDRPVADYWPEFAQAGKSRITVKQLLGGLAGLIYTDSAPHGAILHWDEMVHAIERQAPEWPPGSRGAYHSTTYGFLTGELIRRVDGRPFAQFFREEVTAPLNVEYWFGLTEREEQRIAEIIPNPASATVSLIAQPDTNIGRAWRVRPEEPGLLYNLKSFRRAVIPSGNGHSNAPSTARVFAVLANGGVLDGVRLLSQALIDEARTPQWDGACGLTGRDYRYGLGFFLNKPPLTPFGPNPRAFGHPGLGGAVGIADPENSLAFSYSPNWLCAGEGIGDRSEALIRAAFESASST